VDLIEELRLERSLPSPRAARLIREMVGVSQARMARELGVHRTSVTKWELGVRRPHGEQAVRYLDLLESLQAEVRL
jgi:DNA-binding transcriptional regulator YiaG